MLKTQNREPLKMSSPRIPVSNRFGESVAPLLTTIRTLSDESLSGKSKKKTETLRKCLNRTESTLARFSSFRRFRLLRIVKAWTQGSDIFMNSSGSVYESESLHGS